MAAGLRTTVVGSWWPIPEFQQELRRYHAGELSDEDGAALLSRAAEQAISEQRALGLTEWTGGELFTYEFIEHLQRALTGIKIVVPTKPVIFDYDDLALATIDGEVMAPHGLGYAEAYKRERELPGGVPKATVVGPVEVAINVINELDGLKGQMPNLIKIVNDEIRGLAEAGCPHIQLDVPAFSTLITSGAMTADEAAEIVVGCFDGVETERRGIHILERLDGVIDIAHLALHYFNRYLERDLYVRVPRSIEIAAGLVDEGCYFVEPVEKIKQRAADWARVIGEERLWLAPSCGFGRHTEREIPVLREKLENMVEAAAGF